MTKISAVVTTLNNAATLEACLSSLAFADELLVLDSGSQDATLEIAQRLAHRVEIEPFRGYGPQKQRAVDLARHDWVLVLDADEVLTVTGRRRIEAELANPRAAGYRLPRHERVFWRDAPPAVRPSWQLRLFDRRRGCINDGAIHAAPAVDGVVIDLPAPFRHCEDRSIAQRVDKINRYSSGVADRKWRGLHWRLLVYPSLSFWRFYLLKRYFLAGWPGFIAARTHGFYAFLKVAKRLEAKIGSQADRSAPE